ncbi:hypothetical protein A6456_37640 [Paraburkholderia tropica]|nr:hypothetical protein A6456_37640 [Paraburkholderia tropica]
MRLPFDNRRFVFSLGVGPHRDFDAEAAKQGLGCSNTHGWSAMYSVRLMCGKSATEPRERRARVVHPGIGYQLDAPDTAGPRAFALPRTCV